MTMCMFAGHSVPLTLAAAPGGETPEEQRRYNNRWMFTPATVLSAVDPEPGVVLIRTRDSAVHRRGVQYYGVCTRCVCGGGLCRRDPVVLIASRGAPWFDGFERGSVSVMASRGAPWLDGFERGSVVGGLKRGSVVCGFKRGSVVDGCVRGSMV